MKHPILAAIAGVIAMVLPFPAMAQCTPLAARTWTGSIQLAQHVSVTSQSFNTNGCRLHDDRLNGFDALVLDVASHAGLDSVMSWTAGTSLMPEMMTGTFRTRECRGIPDTGFSHPWMAGTNGLKAPSAIPPGAKWLIVMPYTVAPAANIDVTVYSPGRACPSVA